MSAPEASQEPLFTVHRFAETEMERDLMALIHEGVLPKEVLLKLAAFGYREPDPATGKRRSWVILQNLIDNARDRTAMQPDTRALLDNAMPDAVIDWNLAVNQQARTRFADMYYSVHDLATVVSEYRFETITDPDERFRLSQRVAKGLWRTIVTRHHPEWLHDPKRYFIPQISFTTVHDNLGPRTMQARIISHAIVSDPLLYAVYTEAKTTGVKGIAAQGIASLEHLLSEEHPELYFARPQEQ